MSAQRSTAPCDEAVVPAGPRDDWRMTLAEPARRPLRIWIWTLAAATSCVLVVGGITRLTQSGLSMVKWEPVAGVVPPLDEAQWAERFEQYRRFPEYQRLRPGMTLADYKAIFFWEYLHRLAARAVGLVFLVPFVAFWCAGLLTRPVAGRALVILGFGALQGAMGWLMVQSGLVDRPSVSHYRLAAHLVLAFVIVGLCVWLARDLSIRGAAPTIAASARDRMRRGLAAVGVLLAAQVVWGAFVAGLKAGRLFTTFPLMAGSLVPSQLLALDPPLVNFVQNAATVQWMHRLLGTVLLVAMGLLWLRVRRTRADRASQRLNGVLLSMVATQYGLGIATLVWGVPTALAVLHQVMALAIAGVWVAWVHHVRRLGVLTAEPDAVRLTSKSPPSLSRSFPEI